MSWVGVKRTELLDFLEALRRGAFRAWKERRYLGATDSYVRQGTVEMVDSGAGFVRATGS